MKVKEKTKILLRRVVGIVLIIIGISGIILPILPGWILIFIGLEVIGIQLALFDRIKEYVRQQIDKQKKRGKRND